MKRYYVYIITNKHKTVLYTGVTNDWQRRINEHVQDAITERKTFAGKNNCQFLLLLEEYQNAKDAISREKEIKGWRREKKMELIKISNPEWKFLNMED